MNCDLFFWITSFVYLVIRRFHLAAPVNVVRFFLLLIADGSRGAMDHKSGPQYSPDWYPRHLDEE